MTKNQIPVLTAEMDNLLTTMYQSFQNFLVNWSGNQKDIECGTHIKIPIPAGYVSFYKSDEAFKVSCWLSDTVQSPSLPENQTLDDVTS